MKCLKWIRLPFSANCLAFRFLSVWLCWGVLAFPALAQVQRLDSVIRADLISRLSDKGRNPVGDVELVFADSANYTFHESYSLRKGVIQKAALNRRFKSASVAKPFVAVLVMQLYEEGKIYLDSPITHYLTDPLYRNLVVVKGRDYTAQINARNLLNHTAGLRDYIFDDHRFLLGVRLFPHRKFHPFDHVERYKRHGLNTYNEVPVGPYSYSDTHYLLLALLVEKVTGLSLQENLAQRIVKPAQLQATYVDVPDSGYSNALIQRIHRRRITGTLHPSFEYGGGGLITTANDLSRFMQAVFSGVLLKPETLDTMLVPASNANYTLGWMRKTIPTGYISGYSRDTIMEFGHTGYFGVQMGFIPARTICWVYVKGQSHANPHARNLPIGLSLLKYRHYYLKPKS